MSFQKVLLKDLLMIDFAIIDCPINNLKIATYVTVLKGVCKLK